MAARYELPEDLREPLDVRWADRGSVYLALRFDGVIELELRDPPRAPETILQLATGNGHEYLAVSGGKLVVWSSANTHGSRRLDGRPAQGRSRFQHRSGSVQDVDMSGDRVAVLGIVDVPSYEKSGAVLRVGKLDRPLEQWEEWDLSDAGQGAEREIFRHYGNAATGSIRFLPEGNLVVARQGQPGIHLFSRSGKRLRTLDLAELLDEAESSERLAASGDVAAPARRDTDAAEAARAGDRFAIPAGAAQDEVSDLSRLAGRLLIDEVLPLAEGPALVLRRSGPRGFTWSLLTLSEPPSLEALPIESRAGGARVRGDVDDKGRIVLLIGTRRIRSVERGEIVVLERAR